MRAFGGFCLTLIVGLLLLLVMALGQAATARAAGVTRMVDQYDCPIEVMQIDDEQDEMTENDIDADPEMDSGVERLPTLGCGIPRYDPDLLDNRREYISAEPMNLPRET